MVGITLPAELQATIGDVALTSISEGESGASVFRMDGEPIRYLKISTHDAQFRVKDEYERYQYLSDKSTIPDVLHYQESATHQFLLLNDVGAYHPMHDDLQWTGQQRIQFLAETVKFFHQIPVTDYPYKLTFDQQIAVVQHNIDCGFVDTDDWEDEFKERSIDDLFAEMVSLKPEQEDYVLTHGDMYPMNIRLHGQAPELGGFIDVGAMAVADRYTDFAPIANAIKWHLGAEAIPSFFEHYGIPLNEDKLRFYILMGEFL